MVSLGTLLNVHMPSSNAETGMDWKVKSATMSAHRSMPRFRDVLSFIINLAKIFPGELLSAYFLPGMRGLEAARLTNVKREFSFSVPPLRSLCLRGEQSIRRRTTEAQRTQRWHRD